VDRRDNDGRDVVRGERRLFAERVGQKRVIPNSLRKPKTDLVSEQDHAITVSDPDTGRGETGDVDGVWVQGDTARRRRRNLALTGGPSTIGGSGAPATSGTLGGGGALLLVVWSLVRVAVGVGRSRNQPAAAAVSARTAAMNSATGIFDRRGSSSSMVSL
jgi:hypothetical protein